MYSFIIVPMCYLAIKKGFNIAVKAFRTRGGNRTHTPKELDFEFSIVWSYMALNGL